VTGLPPDAGPPPPVVHDPAVTHGRPISRATRVPTDAPAVPAPEAARSRVDARLPRDLLDRIVAYFEPVEVILFGSRARGEARPDSDLDLLVVLDDDAPAAKLSLRALHEARRGYHRPVGLLA
jgi:hypothetical protein